MKFNFIVNPNSGNGSGMEVWSSAEELLKEKQAEYSVYFTKASLDAMHRAAELTADLKEETAVIAVGGDGTIDEVLNGLNLESPVVFGFIPSGSGNDLGRSMGMNGDVASVIDKLIDHPNITGMDFGEMTLPGGQTRRFAVSCGIGFDAAVCHSIEKSKLKNFFNKLHMGKAVYTAIGFGEYLKAKASQAVVTLDGGQKLEFGSVFFISCQNHPYEGGGYHFAPNAKWNDGKVDVTVINSLNRIKLFPVLINKENGVKENAFIRFLAADEVDIQLNKPMPVHADGEIFGRQSGIRVRSIHGKLRVFS